jgi:hypothetical protein
MPTRIVAGGAVDSRIFSEVGRKRLPGRGPATWSLCRPLLSGRVLSGRAPSAQESLIDITEVTSRYLDALIVRLYDMNAYGQGRQSLLTIAEHSTKPIVNALDDSRKEIPGENNSND